MECVDERSVVALFTTESIKKIWTTNTSHGENDYREVIFALLESGNKIVVKVAANSFTTNERIRMWQRCAEEYARQGYYCPKILSSANGIFPFIFYKGITCIAYAEEYSKYISANQCKNVKPFREELYVIRQKSPGKNTITQHSHPDTACLICSPEMKLMKRLKTQMNFEITVNHCRNYFINKQKECSSDGKKTEKH